jgi:hypothetical protein
VGNLRSNITELRMMNDELKAKEKNDRDYLRGMEKKVLELQDRVSEMTE